MDGVTVTLASVDGVTVTLASVDGVTVTLASVDGVTVTLASVDGVTVTFAMFCSPLWPIQLAVGFCANIKGCYVTPLQTVMTCCCAAAIHSRRGV